MLISHFSSRSTKDSLYKSVPTMPSYTCLWKNVGMSISLKVLSSDIWKHFCITISCFIKQYTTFTLPCFRILKMYFQMCQRTWELASSIRQSTQILRLERCSLRTAQAQATKVIIECWTPTRGRSSLVWRWWDTGTGYPEKLWMTLSWQSSGPGWTGLWATWSTGRCPSPC